MSERDPAHEFSLSLALSYEDAIAVGADLCEETLTEGLANEYVRGQCELIGDLFGRPGVELGDRKQEVLEDMLRHVRGQDPLKAMQLLEDALSDYRELAERTEGEAPGPDDDLVQATRVIRAALTNKEG